MKISVLILLKYRIGRVLEKVVSVHPYYRLNTIHKFFTNSLLFFFLLGDEKIIIFKNLHFETHFQKFAFSGPQNLIVM